MIHSGAIIGAGIPQFRSIILKFIKFPYSYFRSDRFVHVCLKFTHYLINLFNMLQRQA